MGKEICSAVIIIAIVLWYLKFSLFIQFVLLCFALGIMAYRVSFLLTKYKTLASVDDTLYVIAKTEGIIAKGPLSGTKVMLSKTFNLDHERELYQSDNSVQGDLNALYSKMKIRAKNFNADVVLDSNPFILQDSTFRKKMGISKAFLKRQAEMINQCEVGDMFIIRTHTVTKDKLEETTETWIEVLSVESQKLIMPAS